MVGPDRGHQRGQPRRALDCRHHLDDDLAKAAALVSREDLACQGREGVRYAGSAHGAHARGVDPGRQVLQSAVPGERYRSGTACQIARALVD
jgi:hypothetical protein